MRAYASPSPAAGRTSSGVGSSPVLGTARHPFTNRWSKRGAASTISSEAPDALARAATQSPAATRSPAAKPSPRLSSVSGTSSVFDTRASRRLRREQAPSPRKSQSSEDGSVVPRAREAKSTSPDPWLEKPEPTEASPHLLRDAGRLPSSTPGTDSGRRSPSYWERYWHTSPMRSPKGSAEVHAREDASTRARGDRPSASPRVAAGRPAQLTERPAAGLAGLSAAEPEPPNDALEPGTERFGRPYATGLAGSGWTAADERLAAAAVAGDVDKVSDLLADGVRADVPDAHGDTALHKAVRFDCAAIVKAMLKTKPDTNVQGREERTPLHEAALYNHSQCAAELLVAGADYELRDRFRHTAREIGERQNHAEIVQLIETFERLLTHGTGGSSDGAAPPGSPEPQGEAPPARKNVFAEAISVIDGRPARPAADRVGAAPSPMPEPEPAGYDATSPPPLEDEEPDAAEEPMPLGSQVDELFQRLDADGNGSISREELAAAFQASGPSLTLQPAAEPQPPALAPQPAAAPPPAHVAQAQARARVPPSAEEAVPPPLSEASPVEAEQTSPPPNIAAPAPAPAPATGGVPAAATSQRKTRWSKSDKARSDRALAKARASTQSTAAADELEAAAQAEDGRQSQPGAPAHELPDPQREDCSRELPDSYLGSVFQSLDSEHTGYLSMEMVRHAFTKLGLRFAESELAAMPPPDQDGVTKLDLDQFKQVVRNRASMKHRGSRDGHDLEGLYDEIYDGESPSPTSESPGATGERTYQDEHGPLPVGPPIDKDGLAQQVAGAPTPSESGARDVGSSMPAERRARNVSWQDSPTDTQAEASGKPTMRIDLDPESLTGAAIAGALGGAGPEGESAADLPIDAQSDVLAKKPTMRIDLDPESLTDAAIAGALGGVEPEPESAADLPIDAQAASRTKPAMRIDLDPESLTDAAIAGALGGTEPEPQSAADLPIDADSPAGGRTGAQAKPTMRIDLDPESLTDEAIAGALGGVEPEPGSAADLPIDAQADARADSTAKPTMRIDLDPESLTHAAIAGALGGVEPEPESAADLPIDAQAGAPTTVSRSAQPPQPSSGATDAVRQRDPSAAAPLSLQPATPVAAGARPPAEGVPPAAAAGTASAAVDDAVSATPRSPGYMSTIIRLATQSRDKGTGSPDVVGVPTISPGRQVKDEYMETIYR